MKTFIKFLAVMALLGFTMNIDGQIKVDLKRKILNQTNNRVNQRADQGVSKGLDAVEGGIKDGSKKKDTSNDKNQNQPQNSDKGKENKDKPADKQQAQDQETSGTTLESYSKYDFIPGEKVIFYDDFSQDAVGDFPAQWNTNGSGEVVTTNLFPGHWLKFIGNESLWTDALLKLPENYTIEFDAVPIKGSENSMAGYTMRLMQSVNSKAFDAGSAPGKGGFKFTIEYYGTPRYSTWFYENECSLAAISGSKEGDDVKQKENQKYHLAIWVQKSRIRLYQGESKLIDLPKAIPGGCINMDRLRFEYGAVMVTNLRIAVGAPDMRNKLLTEGKLVSYGIYFDVNKDVVRPESYGTLKEIAAVLNENPDVKVKIVGHTDSDGADAANLDLSKKRGAAVKNELVRTFGIDASRLEADGMGETQPVAPNDAPANKAMNRRVEFIKL